MRKVVLYIAMSLDGYIADETGSVDFLNGHGDEADETYLRFIEEVDSVVMGWNTYHQITTELLPDEWVYENIESYVITHHPATFHEKITFVNQNPCELVKKLKCEKGKKIWICGGADIIAQLMNENLIDEYVISVLPIILGQGISLFGGTFQKINLNFVRTQVIGDLVELVYERSENE